jgi:hypothetical protein
MALKAAKARVGRPDARLIPAGVGYGGTVAHEMAVILAREAAAAELAAATSEAAMVSQGLGDANGSPSISISPSAAAERAPKSTRKPPYHRPPPLLLFEGRYKCAYSDDTFSFLPAGEPRDDICQATAALYPLILEAAAALRATPIPGAPSPTTVPSKEAFAVRVASLSDPEEQLDYISCFKPPNVPQVEWDERVHRILMRLAFFKAVAGEHRPARHPPGPVLLFTYDAADD